jgi:hypothetical protein
MPALAPDSTYYPTPAREEDWYEDGISEDKHPFQYSKESRPPHERDEDRVNEFAAIAEYLSIYNAIERSRYIGQLEDDWNDEGAKGYSPLTWRRTAYFAAVQANSARDAGVSIGIPTIAPADHGSIDIHWQNNDRDLLINVPADPNKRATYYGASRAGETTSGLLDARSARPDLLLWLNGGK